jgi:hypothetical protein
VSAVVSNQERQARLIDAYHCEFLHFVSEKHASDRTALAAVISGQQTKMGQMNERITEAVSVILDGLTRRVGKAKGRQSEQAERLA